MMIEAVVFDIGNVLITWNPERHYDARIGEARRKEMFAAVDLHAINDRVDRGEPFRPDHRAGRRGLPRIPRRNPDVVS